MLSFKEKIYTSKFRIFVLSVLTYGKNKLAERNDKPKGAKS